MHCCFRILQHLSVNWIDYAYAEYWVVSFMLGILVLFTFSTDLKGEDSRKYPV